MIAEMVVEETSAYPILLLSETRTGRREIGKSGLDQRRHSVRRRLLSDTQLLNSTAWMDTMTGHRAISPLRRVNPVPTTTTAYLKQVSVWDKCPDKTGGDRG